MKMILMAGAAALAMAAAVPAVAADQAAASGATASVAVPNNPLLAKWTGPYDGVPPWDQVKPELFDEAIQFAIDDVKRESDAIANNPAPPTWENTIEAGEKSGQMIGNVLTLFGVMTDNMSNDAYEALDKKWSPKLSAAFDEIRLNPKLFQRLETLYNERAKLGLDAKQTRLLTREYESAVRNGAKLDPEHKAILMKLNQELSSAFSEFNSKLLADEATFTQASEAEMAGVPQDVKDAAASVAKAKGLPAGTYAIRNTRSAFEPVMAFATNRALREKVWTKFVNRGDNGDANDTNATIAKIVKLRAERAHLLGFKNHAEYRMADTMAKTPQRAMDLMLKVWKPAVQRVHEEVADQMQFAAKDGLKEIKPWDYLYYQEKVRKAKYDLSEDEIKPYLDQASLLKGMHWAAEQLYDLHFEENTGKVPTFNPDVRTFEVTNKKTGQVVGLWYLDTFGREGKRSGAWMNTYRSRARLLNDNLVLASNNNNFNKPEAGKPTLLSIDDASTMFHEFGHAIHYFLVDVKYPSLGGSQRDFVEYPSQVNENWLLTRPVLEKFARHYKTGEPMPTALVDKIKNADKFNQGYATVQYLSSALVDMKLHLDPDGVVDPDAFEKKTLAELGMPKETVMRHRLPQFGHLFSSDAYSAGYYSYLWSETMDADTWEAFEKDPFNRTIADKFRTILLSTGNETDRAEAYRAFRGRDPDVGALLRRRGFPVN